MDTSDSLTFHLFAHNLLQIKKKGWMEIRENCDLKINLKQIKLKG